MGVRATNKMKILYRLERNFMKHINSQIQQRKVDDLIVNFNYQTFVHLTSYEEGYELYSFANPYLKEFNLSFVEKR